MLFIYLFIAFFLQLCSFTFWLSVLRTTLVFITINKLLILHEACNTKTSTEAYRSPLTDTKYTAFDLHCFVFPLSLALPVAIKILWILKLPSTRTLYLYRTQFQTERSNKKKVNFVTNIINSQRNFAFEKH